MVAVAFALTALMLAVTLSRAPITVAHANTPGLSIFGATHRQIEACQSNETLPRGTTGIRLRVFAFTGPRVKAELFQHGHVVVRGEHGSGWRGGVVTVPVRALARRRSPVKLCFSLLTNGNELVAFVGQAGQGALAARGPEGVLPGRIRVEYVQPAHRSWWSIAPEVARRMGLGHAGAGTWSVLVVCALMISVALLCARLLPRELR